MLKIVKIYSLWENIQRRKLQDEAAVIQQSSIIKQEENASVDQQ